MSNFVLFKNVYTKCISGQTTNPEQVGSSPVGPSSEPVPTPQGAWARPQNNAAPPVTNPQQGKGT